MTGKLMCKVLGHRVNRDRIRYRGDTPVGKCRRCGSRMEKTDDGWVLSADLR